MGPHNMFQYEMDEQGGVGHLSTEVDEGDNPWEIRQEDIFTETTTTDMDSLNIVKHELCTAGDDVNFLIESEVENTIEIESNLKNNARKIKHAKIIHNNVNELDIHGNCYDNNFHIELKTEEHQREIELNREICSREVAPIDLHLSNLTQHGMYEKHSDNIQIDVKAEEHPIEIEIKQEKESREIYPTDMYIHQPVKYEIDTTINDFDICMNMKIENQASEIEPLLSLSHMDVASKIAINYTEASGNNFHCQQCHFSTSKIISYKNHLRIHTEEKTIKSRCHCEKCLSSNTAQLYDNKINDEKKPYQCSHCEKSFVRNHTLMLHIRLHTGEKPYPCSYCDKCFSQKGDLVKHQRIHTGEKPYKCNLCERCFSQQTSLLQYQKTHTGEKTNHCSHCEKRFTEKSSLIRHERTHTGEKPYQCTYCGKHFAQKGNLDKHKKVHLKNDTIISNVP